MNIWYKILIIIGIEILMVVVFKVITPKEKRTATIDFKSVFKGLIERAFLTYSLYSGFPHALTLFGALKLGTRLKSADNEQTEEGRKKESNYNDYYLIGNLISVSLSIFYFQLIR